MINNSNKRDKQQGLSLLEIMLVVAILGILAKIGTASYVSYMQRTNRELAKDKLRQSAVKMEKYYNQNGRYLTDSNTWPANYIESKVVGSSGTVYAISFAPSSITQSNAATYRQSFMIIATPVTGTIQASDPAGKLCINQNGIITENAAENCGISTVVRAPGCSAGIVYNPCSSVCQGSGGVMGGPYSVCSGNCDRVTVCGNPVSPGCSGNCQDSVIEGPCSGNCDRVILYVPDSITVPCNGNCHNITVIRTD